MNYKQKNIFSTETDVALDEILADRGVTDIDNFKHPTPDCELDPYLLDNIVAGKEMLLKHLNRGSKILFIVDSDADGFTSSSILWLYIKHYYPEADLSFTVHEHKQHGLNDKIEWIINENYYDLVLCPDSASYDVEEHKALMECGIDCLVIDHHEQLFDSDGNPVVSNFKNTIVINNQLSERYENKSLCGAGMVYKFCEVLDDHFGDNYAKEFLDLAAVGEIADVMNKTNTETNYIITRGLKNIKNKGLKAMLKKQSHNLEDKAVEPFIGLNSIDIAFNIGPLINAVTRVGSIKEKEIMFRSFIEPDELVPNTGKSAKTIPYETCADQTARVSGNLRSRQNNLRDKAIQLIEFKIQKEELDLNNVILIEIEDEDNIPQELGGLVAMAIVNRYHKPCMMLRRNSDDVLQGSIRNSEDFEGLPNFKSWFENCGYGEYAAGHANACGCGIKSDNIDSFLKYANSNLSSKSFEKCYNVDYVFDASSPYVKSIGSTFAAHPEYFGNGVKEVTYVVKNIPLNSVQIMGANSDTVNVKCGGVDFIRFKDAEFAADIVTNKTKAMNVYGTMSFHSYRGITSLQFKIDDYEFTSEDYYDYEF